MRASGKRAYGVWEPGVGLCLADSLSARRVYGARECDDADSDTGAKPGTSRGRLVGEGGGSRIAKPRDAPRGRTGGWGTAGGGHCACVGGDPSVLLGDEPTG